MISLKPLKNEIELELKGAFSPTFLSVFSLKFVILYVIYSCLIQASYSQDLEALTRLRDQYAKAVNKSVDPLTSKYIQQLELIKQNCTNAEAIIIENEILKMRQLRDDGFSELASDQVTVAGSNTATGKDLKNLLGIWIAPSTSSSMTTTFEFKSAKEMTITRAYNSSNGVREEMTNYIIKGARDSIVIEQVTSSGSSSEYKNYYEISMPFSYSNPEIVQIYVRPSGLSKTTIRLERKPQAKE
jgi:hypothetical protein